MVHLATNKPSVEVRVPCRLAQNPTNHGSRHIHRPNSTAHFRENQLVVEKPAVEFSITTQAFTALGITAPELCSVIHSIIAAAELSQAASDASKTSAGKNWRARRSRLVPPMRAARTLPSAWRCRITPFRVGRQQLPWPKPFKSPYAPTLAANNPLIVPQIQRNQAASHCESPSKPQ